MDAMCFFERNGPSVIEWDEDSLQMSGTWRHSVGLVVWANLPRIAPEADQDFSDALAQDVIRVLVEAGVVFSLEQRAERVFERYTLAEKKLLMYPYAGFRVALELQERYRPCVTPLLPPVARGAIALGGGGGHLLY
jgi:hypothetical protein